jgi:hypothetical protein
VQINPGLQLFLSLNDNIHKALSYVPVGEKWERFNTPISIDHLIIRVPKAFDKAVVGCAFKSAGYWCMIIPETDDNPLAQDDDYQVLVYTNVGQIFCTTVKREKGY